MNGPLLVRNCEVVGFEQGISTSRAVNGQTFESITLRDQRQFGFKNEGQSIAIRGLLSLNSVPAVHSYGCLCLVDAKLEGKAESNRWPAVINYNGGRIFLRDINTSGYARAVGDVTTPDWFAATRIQGEDKPGSLGPRVIEYCSHPTITAFPSTKSSLRLTVKEPPQVPLDPVEQLGQCGRLWRRSNRNEGLLQSNPKCDELRRIDHFSCLAFMPWTPQ